MLYDVLTEIIVDEQQCEWIYNIVTDTMDYFVGWHSPLVPTDPAYNFVKQLNVNEKH